MTDAATCGRGQAATVRTLPSTATRRAGMPRLSSQPGAPTPRMMAAVLAMLAATAVSATADTVRHTGGAGRPVLGSRM